jgi:Family of unknown function (DUF5990)
MRIRIEGRDLPGRSCAASGDFPGYHNVHVGVQRRNRGDELLDLQPGDAPCVVWTFDATVAPGPAGPDVRGPYVQGGPGRRFIYLSWGTVDADDTFVMFRRAKLFLADVEPDTIAAADRAGHLIARLRLSDPEGHPVCARIRPPIIQWSAESA